MGEQIKYFINNHHIEILIDITKIYNTLPYVNYKISCFLNGKNYSVSNLKVNLKKLNEEYLFFVSFSLPVSALKSKFISFFLQQICTDEFGNQTAICYSCPFKISTINYRR